MNELSKQHILGMLSMRREERLEKAALPLLRRTPSYWRPSFVDYSAPKSLSNCSVSLRSYLFNHSVHLLVRNAKKANTLKEERKFSGRKCFSRSFSLVRNLLNRNAAAEKQALIHKHGVQ